MLEDGMTLSRVDFSAHDMQFIEGSRLALNTVASVYHVNPTMIGLLDNANYSNVREFRRMLYGDTLGPDHCQIEDRLNTFLVPQAGHPPRRVRRVQH
jgi:phage portal protein BeeE